MTQNDNQTAAKSTNQAFWQPWGTWGCLWRSILFLLGMTLICLLFALLQRGCNNPISSSDDDPFNWEDDTVQIEEDPYKDLPPTLRDSSLVDDWRDSIPDVEELPDPDDNYIPPVDTTLIVPNPEDSLTQIVGGQLIVFFNSKDVKGDMAAFARKFKQVYPGNGYQILYYNPTAGTMLIGVPQDKLLIVADELHQKIPGIDFLVTTNDILNGASVPNDPGFGEAAYDEYFKLIQAYDAWDITRGSADVKVAIVDSYFDLSSPEIGERFTDRINIADKTLNVLPPPFMPLNPNELGNFCHGSHVAGISIGAQNNRLGCSGIAPECTWIPIALGKAPWSSLMIFEGVLYAIYRGADVVNLSLGMGLTPAATKLPLADQILISQTLSKRGEAVWNYIAKVADDHNCILCKAAGNDHVFMGMEYMNRSPMVVNVEAVDGKGQIAEFSNFGTVKEADMHYSTVSAPGVNIWSVSVKHCAPLWSRIGYKVSTDGFQEMSGTSMAAPVVTGAVALLKSKKKDLKVADVIKILTATGKRFDTSGRIGPTIQIRDALDATGGELLNFDDLMKDHDLLIGKWKSTHELQIDRSGTTIDDIWTYFIFTSPTSGTVEHHAIRSGRIYRTGLTVKWGTDRITIYQQGEAVSSDGNRLEKDDFICRPNKDRLLEASCMRRGNKMFDFMLEKVN